MNNEVMVKEEVSVLSELKNTKQLCAELMQTPHYAKMGEAGIFAIITCARSLQMDPIYALNGSLFYVQGRVGMGSQTMAAIIRSKGHSVVKDPKSNDSICILHGKRVDNGDTWTTTFSVEDAKRAGICKNVWNSYPGVMCYNRAMAFMARQLFPDIIKNAGYDKDELIEIAEKEGSKSLPAREAEIEFISPDQIMELDDLVADCSPEYKLKFDKYLTDSKIVNKSGVVDFAVIPLKSFDTFKLWAIKDKAKYHDIKNAEAKNGTDESIHPSSESTIN